MATLNPLASAVSSTSPDPAPRRRASAWAWLLPLLLIAAAGWYGWHWWQTRQADVRTAGDDAALQLDALTDRVAALRRDQRAQGERLRQADATNRVLRDELLGLGERSAIIEDSFAKFADPDRHGAQALRLDEAELLLSLGQQRLLIAGDLHGARRAHALAAGVLAGVDDPDYLSLRQTLGQERAALDTIDHEPRSRVLTQLDGFARSIAVPTPRSHVERSAGQPWWRRAFASIIDAQPIDRAVAVQPADIAAANAGLQLEISLARAAAERRDVDSYRAALRRADDWLTRLLPPSTEREQHREQLRRIAAMPLSLQLPTLGTTLDQLRQSRAARPELRR